MGREDCRQEVILCGSVVFLFCLRHPCKISLSLSRSLCHFGRVEQITESHQSAKADTSGTAKALAADFATLTSEDYDVESIKKVGRAFTSSEFGMLWQRVLVYCLLGDSWKNGLWFFCTAWHCEGVCLLFFPRGYLFARECSIRGAPVHHAPSACVLCP